MPVDESSMSETAQKAISKLRQQIDVQKELIRKEEVVEGKKGESYVCTRAKISLESAEVRLNALDEELEAFKKELDGKRKKFEAIIEANLKIIERETSKKTPTILRAETAIDGLRLKVEKILNGWNTDVVVPDEPSHRKSDKEIVAEMTRVQLAQMTSAERLFFEQSNNRQAEAPEPVYMYRGERVSKFEYDRFTNQDNIVPVIREKKQIKMAKAR